MGLSGSLCPLHTVRPQRPGWDEAPSGEGPAMCLKHTHPVGPRGLAVPGCPVLPRAGWATSAPCKGGPGLTGAGHVCLLWLSRGWRPAVPPGPALTGAHSCGARVPSHQLPDRPQGAGRLAGGRTVAAAEDSRCGVARGAAHDRLRPCPGGPSREGRPHGQTSGPQRRGLSEPTGRADEGHLRPVRCGEGGSHAICRHDSCPATEARRPVCTCASWACGGPWERTGRRGQVRCSHTGTANRWATRAPGKTPRC